MRMVTSIEGDSLDKRQLLQVLQTGGKGVKSQLVEDRDLGDEAAGPSQL